MLHQNAIRRFVPNSDIPTKGSLKRQGERLREFVHKLLVEELRQSLPACLARDAVARLVNLDADEVDDLGLVGRRNCDADAGA